LLRNLCTGREKKAGRLFFSFPDYDSLGRLPEGRAILIFFTSSTFRCLTVIISCLSPVVSPSPVRCICPAAPFDGGGDPGPDPGAPGRTAPRYFPTFPPVTGLYRPIFGTHRGRFRSIRAQNRLPLKTATDFLANVTEKVYRIGQSEAKTGSDDLTPRKGSLHRGVPLPGVTGHVPSLETA